MPKKSSSVDLFSGVSSERKNSSLFINQIESKKISEDEKLNLSPIDFFCEHYDFVKKVSEHLSAKYSEGLMKPDVRKKIETESYNDVVNLLTENKLLPRKELVAKYIQLIFADIFGLGVLEPLMNDDEVDEIIVQSHDVIIVERHGKLEESAYRFPSVDNAVGIVTKIITPLNLRLNRSHPNVNAQLPDGSRLNASMAPLRANGEVSINIRKFSASVQPLAFYAQKYKSESQEMVTFLQNCVASRQSMLVSGGTGSGKTTLLNSLSMAIPEGERIITVEDTLELKLQQRFVESYQTIEANMEGKGAFTMQQVIIECLRKRPDRIIVGECRGPEIVEMLNAMNTGHEGSLSTIHANNTKDMISRALTMIRSNESTNSLNESTIYQMLDSAINIIVQTNRLQDGSRKVTAITEVVGVGKDGFDKLRARGILSENAKVEKDKIYLQDIFRFKQTGVDENKKVRGQFVATGYVPYCLEKMQEKGYGLREEFFAKRVLLEV